MRFSILLLIATIGKTPHAIGHLRSSFVGNDHNNVEQQRYAEPQDLLLPPPHEVQNEYFMHYDEYVLEDKATTLEKNEKRKVWDGDAAPVQSVHHSRETLDSVDQSTTSSVVESTTVESIEEFAPRKLMPKLTPHVEPMARIIGGDPSNMNEFPYFGTYFV